MSLRTGLLGTIMDRSVWKTRVGALLGAFRQVALASPLAWPRLPAEILWFLRSQREFSRLVSRGGSSRRAGLQTQPVLFERSPLAFDAHYTYQAAWAAQRIARVHPARHVDVSSDVRFVVQLTALCPVLWVEYRPVDLGLERLETRQGDVTALPFRERSIPSLSCMHVVEHVGLGRYGDPLAPDGHERACGELARVLAPGGALFLSMPVGRPRVCFNAHRVLDPASVPGLVPELRLVEFSVVTTAGRFRELVRPEDYRGEDYACGLYWLARP